METRHLSVKESAHQLIDLLPDNASWDDVMYELMVREEIELGMADSMAGNITPVDDVRKEYGLD